MKLLLAILVEENDLEKIMYHVGQNTVVTLTPNSSEPLPPGETIPDSAGKEMLGRVVGAQEMQL